MSLPPPPYIDREGLEPIPVFISADERYARYIAVVIASIMEQTEFHVHFHILNCGITKITVQQLTHFVTVYPYATITFHTIDSRLFAEYPSPGHFSSAMYSRFYIADIVPTITKAIYIDADTCILGDIAELFAYDLDGHGLGAVSTDRDNIYLPHYPTLLPHKERIGLHSKDCYFTSGFLLIDCVYWRKYDISKQCMECLASSYDIIAYPDQDILNIVFASKYKALPYYSHYFTHEPSEQYTTYIAHHIKENHAMVVHYCSQRKPWNTPDSDLAYESLWWYYAKLTPFYLDFTVDIIALRTKKLINAPKKSLYNKSILYLKYKTSWGARREKYKKKYRRIQSL